MLKVSVLGSHRDVDAAAWDALVGPGGSPFLEHVFLRTLEDFGCAVPETGWTPRPVVVRDGERVVGAASCWVKEHSMGEFVYDHGWADAAARAGLPYYPKLVVGVPFSPVTGRRLLVAEDVDRTEVLEALLAGIEAAGRDCHGVHVLFDTEQESELLAARGAFQRLQYQFHWTNQGYQRFDDWLAAFPSDKRNKLRRERKEVAGLRFDARTGPTGAELAALHRFHRNTAEQFGPWGRVYLSLEAFLHLGEVWGDRLHTVLARDGDRVVAGTFNVLKGDRLYGRYWGCEREIKFLHFEVCYYRPIEDAIARGVTVFEPGHGGTHKVTRGFHPTLTYSNHLLRDRRLHDALAHHTAGEARRVRQAVRDHAEGR